MRDISFSANKFQVAKEIARVLHGPDYAPHSPLPLNFDIKLFFNRRSRLHTGKGALTLPTVELGEQFLREYGQSTGRKLLPVCGRNIKFTKSRNDAKPDIVENIRRLPYQDAQAVEERDKRTQQLQSESISVTTLQFGWECRDQVFSSELEYHFSGDALRTPIRAPRLQDRFFTCHVSFDAERREIRLSLRGDAELKIIAIRFAQIQWCSADVSSRTHSIFFCLHTPPAYESQLILEPGAKRQRIVALDSAHALVAPYTSLAIRLICRDRYGVSNFRRLSQLAHLQSFSDSDYPVEHRGLFSNEVLEELENWLRELEWIVGFQVEALVRSLVIDPTEILGLRHRLASIIEEKGAHYTSLLLRHFATRVKALYWDSTESGDLPESVEQCFISSQREYSTQSPLAKPADSVFDCLHVTITPTTRFLEGPFPERSNRVIRWYPNHHNCFLRVSFVDEDRLQFRFDREVDGPAFTRLRVGPILKTGLVVAGRFFKFLAYSQSALKEHAVWFVADFFDRQNSCLVDASTIIKSLGTFDNLEFDPTLIYCPARYGARISQAFTATDVSISVEAEEVLLERDVQDANKKWCFTDGVGTISLDLASDIWRKLQSGRRRAKRVKSFPRAFQVRFMGSKGMLSVDHLLSGRVVCLRDSMIKFEAPESREIEIAQAFERPRKYFLNRPLIMILEHLGEQKCMVTFLQPS